MVEKRKIEPSNDIVNFRKLIAELSLFRTELMGAAIIMVMLCHNTIQFPNSDLNFIWKSISSYFQVGVDIFLILSGFGCVFSIQKTSTYREFIWRRISRIIPTYIIVDGAWCIMQKIIWNTSVIEIAKEYSLASFFIHGVLSEWYIAAILVLYVSCPFFYYLLKCDRKRYYLLFVTIFIVSICASFFDLPDTIYTINEIFIVRIPAFGVGILLGEYMISGEFKNSELKGIHNKNVCWIVFFLLCVTVSLLVVNSTYNNINKWCVMRALFLPLGLLLSVFLCRVMRYGNIRRIFRLFGGITLELYLLHGKILNVVDSFVQNKMGNGMSTLIIIQIISVLLAVGIALIIQKGYRAIRSIPVIH